MFSFCMAIAWFLHLDYTAFQRPAFPSLACAVTLAHAGNGSEATRNTHSPAPSSAQLAKSSVENACSVPAPCSLIQVFLISLKLPTSITKAQSSGLLSGVLKAG